MTQAPEFIIEKEIGNSSAWTVQTTVIDGSLDYLYLNTSAEANDYNVDAPTSTVFDIGRNSECIAYLWHSVPGLQKFGTYEGLGGTANGSFVELGFRPAIVWVKNVDTASQTNTHWCVFDNNRPGYNTSPAQNRLHLDEDVRQDDDRVDDGQGIDILSNGFRVRSNNWYETNLDGATYIYCAWAETPSVDLYGGGANAR